MAYFHRSTVAKTELAKQQLELLGTEYVLILDIITRWNSSLDMFARALLLQECVEATLIAMDRLDLNLSKNEWTSLRELCLVLQPFKDVTEELSSEKYISLSKLIPMIGILKNHLINVMRKISIVQIITFAASLSNGLDKRFNQIEFNEHASIATYLDPRFKSFGFTDPEALCFVESRIEAKIGLMVDEDQDVVLTRSHEIVTTEPTPSNASFWSNFDQRVQQTRTNENDPTQEFPSYKQLQIVDRSVDPLSYWKLNQTQYPKLSQLAKDYLCCPASSVPSERVFSKTGTVDSDKRNRLAGELVGQLVFLNANAPLIG